MRLKTFSAPSMKECIALVRAELGPDAVIVSTLQSRSAGVRITAAVEQAEPSPPASTKPAFNPPFKQDSAQFERVVEAVRCTLEEHATPEPIAARLITAVRVFKSEEPRMALAGAFDDCFRFAPIGEKSAKPMILIGPPGVGKTVTAAKIAARARLKKQHATLVSTDTQRAGAIEQIEKLANLMGASFRIAASADQLATLIEDCSGEGDVIIDSAGTNPYSDSEMDALSTLVLAGNAEPILVLDAGGDAAEYAEIAAAFATLGATRLIATRLDMARRFGSLLAAADAGRLKFSNVSAAPAIGKGLTALNPVSLARLLLPEPPAISEPSRATPSAAPLRFEREPIA